MLVVRLFWPAIVGSVVVSAIGTVRRRALGLVFGAWLSLPASLYLAATP